MICEWTSPDVDHGHPRFDPGVDVVSNLSMGLGSLTEVTPHLLVGLVKDPLLLVGGPPRCTAPGTHTYTHTHTHRHMHTHTRVHTHTRTCRHVHTNRHAHKHTQASKHAHTHTHKQFTTALGQSVHKCLVGFGVWCLCLFVGMHVH